MATYFDGNREMQGNGDALQTLILMNPAYVGYSENQHHLQPPPPPPPSSTNFIFFNSQIHHLAGIPLQAASSPYNNGGGAAREVTRAKQGLSLSLSSQQPAAPSQPAPEKVVLSCKYLKVAQELLDEVVNIRKEAKNGRESAKEKGDPKNTAAPSAPPAGGDGRAKRGAELTTAEKQEIQMKKTKLVDMLHEVEQRYKQYEQQMQMVIRWLEEAAGVGSAKTYTALALQTISKQFRCLKDAIMAQIQAASNNLGENGAKMEVSRFKYIDNQIRQQQQHFVNNAWRPQRGLPERSVSVLRAWLFQHFLHPYPKDSDKVMLAKEAGLTRSQVSNWFINARVRLWKPMVEEMYAEEMKAHQRNGSEDDETGKSEYKQVPNKNLVDQNTSPTAKNNAGFSLIGSSEMDSIITQGRSPKKPRNADVSMSSMSDVDNQQNPMKFDYDSERQSRQGFTITGAPANFFGTYDPIVGIEHFQQPYSSNGVSLTLGLQHPENLSNQNFLPNTRVEAAAQGKDFGSLNAITHTSGVYDNNKRFPAQLLPDFVT